MKVVEIFLNIILVKIIKNLGLVEPMYGCEQYKGRYGQYIQSFVNIVMGEGMSLIKLEVGGG